MRKRLPLILLFVALAGVAFWLWKSNTGTTLAGPLADFAVPDTAHVSRIFIADKEGKTVDLVRGEHGWTVNGLPANPIPVNLLLKTFLRVEVRSPVAKSMENNVMKVMASKAKKVEIYEGGSEPSKIWWVGHATQDHFGTFALLEKPDVGKSDVPFVLGMTGFSGILNTRFHTKLDDWRSSVLAQYPDLTKITSVRVEHPAQDSAGYRVTFENDKLALLNANGTPVPMDTIRVQDLMLHLRDPHFEYHERTITRAQQDSVKNSIPLHVLTITDKDKHSLRIPFFKKAPYAGEKNLEMKLLTEDLDRMFAVVDDTALVVVQRYWFDRVVPYLSELQPRNR
jgi:hypothetical protein